MEKATAMFAEKAASLESTSALAMAEVGQQCLLRGKLKEAQRYYKVRYQLNDLDDWWIRTTCKYVNIIMSPYLSISDSN